MAAFLGFCVQSLDVVKGAHSTVPYRGYVENVSPQEQWDNIPVIGKLQILVFVGMLESYGEIPGEVPHYTQPGGIPGYYPPLVGKRPELLFNLYDPFDFFVDDDEESKERGLNVELNNGRAAQLAIMAMLTASKGLIVPPLDAIPGFPKYSGAFPSGRGPEPSDDPVVARLRDAGAIVVGATVMTEFGISPIGWNAHYGGARNPWDADRYAGGSSTGSAVAVAAGLLPVAVGFDGGGSVRVPAALTGLYGLAAGFARVPFRTEAPSP